MKKLLILGLGDVAKRALSSLTDWEITAPMRVQFDLDTPDFTYLPREAAALLYTVPPRADGVADMRLMNLLKYWRAHGGAPRHVVYISTSGVYGDCAGAWVDESRPLNPESERAVLRVNAERQWQNFAHELGLSLTILRAPGIYAAGRLPLQRLRDGVPILHADEDAFSNHIHADDLAHMCVAALNRPRGVVVYNACDDQPIKMGDWFCAVAQKTGLPMPIRMSKDEVQQQVTPTQWSFMRESRRLSNHKIKRDLPIRLRYSTALDFLLDF
ncbi:MAG: SDR family oxidoreductase [Formosimonas sp.]